MRAREAWVKRLDSERRGVLREPFRRHQGDGSQTTNVAVVQRAAVVQSQLDRGIAALLFGQIASIDEERAGEARLHDEAVAGRQVDHDELRAAPASTDRCARHAPREIARTHLSQNVRSCDRDADDARPGDLTIEVARDRLSFR